MTERFPRFLHEFVDEPPTGFPHKLLSLAAFEQGTLTLKTVLTTAAGDRIHQTHQLFRSDALDLITALSEWVASPDSILAEHSDGTPVRPVEVAGPDPIPPTSDDLPHDRASP